MTLPNHAVNVMYMATRLVGAVILIVIAGPYVGQRGDEADQNRWPRSSLGQLCVWLRYSGSTSELVESSDGWISHQSLRKCRKTAAADTCRIYTLFSET
jgi:hypothetical protein